MSHTEIVIVLGLLCASHTFAVSVRREANLRPSSADLPIFESGLARFWSRIRISNFFRISFLLLVDCEHSPGHPYVRRHANPITSYFSMYWAVHVSSSHANDAALGESFRKFKSSLHNRAAELTALQYSKRYVLLLNLPHTLLTLHSPHTVFSTRATDSILADESIHATLE